MCVWLRKSFILFLTQVDLNYFPGVFTIKVHSSYSAMPILLKFEIHCIPRYTQVLLYKIEVKGVIFAVSIGTASSVYLMTLILILTSRISLIKFI